MTVEEVQFVTDVHAVVLHLILLTFRGLTARSNAARSCDSSTSSNSDDQPAGKVKGKGTRRPKQQPLTKQSRADRQAPTSVQNLLLTFC